MRIKIIENGPYRVTGGIPLREKIIEPKGHGSVFSDGRELPQGEDYLLCRCGRTRNAPFCDATHSKVGFNGTETASKTPYMKRVESTTQGTTMELLDDGRCANTRFCHRDAGSVWDLTENDSDPNSRSEALISAHECPSGRLVMVDQEGNVLEEESEPELIIMQDPSQGVSAGIFVKGPIVVESSNGTEYEVRNRQALCRCGASADKPFCNSNHVKAGYIDRR